MWSIIGLFEVFSKEFLDWRITTGDMNTETPAVWFSGSGRHRVLNNNSSNIQQFFQKGRSCRQAGRLSLATAAINGWTAKVLDLVTPVTAR